MKTKTKSLVFSLLCLIAVAFSALFIKDGIGATEKAERECEINLTVTTDGKLEIVKNGTTDYIIVYATNTQTEQSVASELRTALASGGVSITMKAEWQQQQQIDKEILIGTTNRTESQDFLKEVTAQKRNSDDLAWGYAVKGGKLLFVASEAAAFEQGKTDFVNALKSYDYSIPADFCVIHTMTKADYEKVLEEKKEAEKQKKIEELKAENAKFTQSTFGEVKEMPTDEWPMPNYWPTLGDHPRLFFTEADIDDIYYNLFNHPDFDTLRKTFWEYANAEDFTGKFPTQYKNGVAYNYNTTVVGQLEAKAMAYLLTGDELYGYEAIIGAKNMILTINYPKELHQDPYHGASTVMIQVAKVYDWCYDLMSQSDKNQLIGGVCNILAALLENGMQFPPSGMNGVSGHGTGPQFTRDWLTVSLAFYDEVPSWWTFVGGRYFSEYIPVIDYCYQGGWGSQGTATYGDGKYATKGWAALLIKNATGEFPYIESFSDGAYFFISHIQSNGYYFQTGDGNRNNKGSSVTPNLMLIAAALFDDPTLANLGKKFSDNYTKFYYGVSNEYTACDILIFVTLGPDLSKYSEDDLKVDLIQFFDYPAGNMTARNSWDEDGAVVLMRIGNMTMANHDLNDHGTFQIYYKGLLAGTSGAYNKYGSYTHEYYLQATIAHNGLLVFDPDKADAEPIHGTDETCKISGCTHQYCLTNAARYYYSGSQRDRGEAGTIEKWLSGEYDMGEVFGRDWRYDADGNAKWAYIAGDITKAYPTETVAYAGRKMLTVFTGDETYPMLFFTYDQLTGTDGGEDFKKSFLLHTVKEPVVDEDAFTAVVTVGEGRLFLHSLSGAKKIEAIGGEGKAYWINGKNCCNDGYTFSDAASTIWGRIELSTTGNLSDSFLTAMYVTDSTNDTPLEVEYFNNDNIDGALIMRNYIVFTKTDSNMQQYREFSFTTEGGGLYSYYIAGLEAGTWQVQVDGVTVAWALSDNGASIITFTAPTGEVTLIPGDDVIGTGGKITYNTFGGMLPDGARQSYSSDNATPLPENVVRGEDTFIGWYTSPTYEPDTLVTEVPMGTEGTFHVYARYLSTLINADFTAKDFFVEVLEGSKKKIVSFSASNKGASFNSKTDADGTRYVEWVVGEKDSIITYSSTLSNFSTMSSDDECATFTVTMARDMDRPVISTNFRIYTKKTVSGTEKTSRQYIFTTDSQGNVKLGAGQSEPILTLTDKPVTLKFVLDFKNEYLYAYDGNGYLLSSLELSVPKESGAENMSEWRKLLNNQVLYWYGGSASGSTYSDATLKVYEIKIEESDRVALSRPQNAIVYVPNGGTMPEDGVPKAYNPKATTSLAGALPTKVAHDFDGWYYDSELTEPAVEIEAGKTGTVVLYAKWKPSADALCFDLGGGKYTGTFPITYDSVNGTDISAIIPTKGDNIFGGWYTSPTFEENTKVDTLVGVGGTTTITLYAKWNPPLKTIVYGLGGGELSGDAPTFFSNSAETVLQNPTKSGFVFSGWYTSPTFEENTKITAIPACADDYFYVYAKWVFTVTEDFNDSVNITSGSKGLSSGIKVYTDDGAGASFVTVTDGSDSYLKWVKGSKTSRLAMSTGNIAKISSTAISYELVLGKDGDAPFDNFTFRTIAKVDVNGNKLASNNALYLFKLDKNGAYLSTSGSTSYAKTAFATFDENGKITVRVTVDFANEHIIGYTADGNTVTSTLKIPESSGAKNGLEYMKTFTEYVFYFMASGSAESTARVYSMKIGDTAIFDEIETLNKTIYYNTDGGTMPESYPAYFDKASGTDLSEVIPTKDGYEFLGWYETPDFSGAAVTLIGKNRGNAITLYAKWEISNNTIEYDAGGGTMPESYPASYDKTLGTDITSVKPTMEFYKFVGWYTSPTFEEDTLVSVIGIGKNEPITVYAKWIYSFATDYENAPFDEIVSATQKHGGVSYIAKDKSASFKILKDANGKTYLELDKEDHDPIISVNGDYVSLMNEHCVSYEITIGRNASDALISSAARITAPYAAGDTEHTSKVNASIQLFATDANGNLYIGSDTKTVVATMPEYTESTDTVSDGGTIPTRYITFRFVVDYENLKIIAYLDDGSTVETSFTVPAKSGLAADDGIGYQKLLTSNVLYWRAQDTPSDGSIRIYGINITEGNVFI